MRYRKICGFRENINMNDTREEARQWLISQLDKKGHGARGELAAFLGVRNETITRMTNHKPGKELREIKAGEMMKMSEFFGTPAPGLAIISEKSKPNIEFINVIGKVAANNWIDVEHMDFDYSDVFQVPTVSGYPPHLQFALIVDGNCLNKIAANGDVLVCLNLQSSDITPEPDDLVIVERRRYGGQMIERTAKRLKKTTSGLELWPESNDLAHQEPISLNTDHANDGIEVQIIGKVLWILRKP